MMKWNKEIKANENIEIEYGDVAMKSTWGSHKPIATYYVTHTKNGYTNKYYIACEIAGLNSSIPEPYLRVVSAELEDDNAKTNPETLTSEAITALFENKIG